MSDRRDGGIIQPSRSPCNNPLVPGKKKDGGLCLCFDFGDLNEHTKQCISCIQSKTGIPFRTLTVYLIDRTVVFLMFRLKTRISSTSNREKTAFFPLWTVIMNPILPFGLRDVPVSF